MQKNNLVWKAVKVLMVLNKSLTINFFTVCLFHFHEVWVEAKIEQFYFNSIACKKL